MFKLVVLSALLAVVAAKPSVLTSSLVSPAVYAAPTAYSSHYGGGLVASPLVSTYAASPLVSTYAASPVVSSYAASPLLASPYHLNAGIHAIRKRSVLPLAYSSVIAPAAVSHQSRVDVHTPLVSSYIGSPLVSTYAASPLVASGPLALAPHTPANVIGANGVPLDTIEVVNARAAHYTAKALNAHGIYKRSVVAPLAYSSVLAPAAVSHSSRVDIPSARTLVAAPVVSSYSAPLVSAYSAPLVSAYSTPLVNAYNTPLVATHGAALSLHHY